MEIEDKTPQNISQSETESTSEAQGLSTAEVTTPLPHREGQWGESAVSSFISNVRRNLFSRLDRYIMAKFLGTYVFSIVLIITIAVVFDFSENSDKFASNHAPMAGLAFYYLDFVPFYANMFSALFVFISVIFFTAKLAENSEIIAMLSTGMSFSRLLRPYLISSALIAALSFYLGSEVIPRGSVDRIQFEYRYKTSKNKKPQTATNLQLQVDTGVIAYIEFFDGIRKNGTHFSLDKFENKQLISHLTAERIEYDTLADERFHWKLRRVKIRTLKGLREHIVTKELMDSVILMEPSDFLPISNIETTMTNSELLAYIDKQQLRGAGGIKVFEVEYHKRFSSPFAAFILSTIGLCLSFRKRKGGMGGSLGIGIALSAAYVMFQTISSTFAINSNWPAIIAAWTPNVIFTAIAFWLYRKSLR